MTYRIKLVHLGHVFEMLMEAPDRQEIIRRLAHGPAKIVYIRPHEKDFVLNPSHTG